MQSTGAPLGAFPIIDQQKRAWLTYQAMDHSDNIVLFLETDNADESGEAVITGANEAFLRASGYDEDQIRGRSLGDFLPDRPQYDRLRNAIRRSESLRGEKVILRSGGGVFTLGLHLLPVPGPNESLGHRCFVIVGRDITAILELRTVQASVQKLLAKVFNCINEAVIIIDEAGLIVMTNPQANKLLGCKAIDLVGRTMIDIVAPSGRHLMAMNVQRQLAKGGDITYEVPVLREDGTKQEMHVMSTLVESDDRKKFRIIALRPAAPTSTRSESAGQIKLVGLEEVRDALGIRWPTVAARAMATAEAVIKRRCGKEDSFSRVDDISFLICFGTLDVQEASFRAAMMGREIRDRLIGQGGDPDSAQVRAIAASVMFPYQQDKPVRNHHAALLVGLNGQMRQIEEDARQTLRATLVDARCEVEPIFGRNPEETVCTLVCLPEAVERKLLCAFSILPRNETDAFDLNGLLLTLAAEQATTALARGESRPLLLPVSFDVFSSRAMTERYIGLCRKVDHRLLKTLIFLFSELPEGLPRSRLFDCINLLRPYCCAVGFQVDDPALLASVNLAPGGHGIVAFPQSTIAAMPAVKLKALADFVHAKRMKLLVRNLDSTHAAVQTLAQGADLISMAQGAI